MNERTLREEAALIAFKALLEGSMEWRARPNEAADAAVTHADAFVARLATTAGART